jgi:hypothetical protein
MFESAYALQADGLSAAATIGRRLTQSYSRSENSADEHTEVVMRDEVTKRIPGRYRDYLMMAIISINLAAVGAVLFAAFGRM